MRRIYPDFAYGPGPRAACYWPTTVDAPPYPAATGALTCDTAIIGAGFTGLSAALHLAQDGVDTVVLDAETPGWGASGRNGGFCCLGGAAASNTILTRLHGEPARREFRSSEKLAVELAASLIRAHEIEADTHSDGESIMAHTAKAMRGFEKRAARIETDYGVTPSITPASGLAASGMKGPFFGALNIPIGFGLNPMKYTLGLARAAMQAGARIHGHSQVQRIDQAGGFTLSTQTAQITCKRLIIATNGYSSDDLPGWMRGRYLPVQSNVSVTRTLSDDEIAAQGWSSLQMSYDDRYFMHYFRLMPNKRLLFGMPGGLISLRSSNAAMYRIIRSHLARMFPAWADVDIPHNWNGMMSISRDLTPYAGPIPEMPGAFTALSYHGNGVAMGSYAGALLADLAQGKSPRHPYPKIMQTPPKRFPLGRLRRALLWPPYMLARLTGG